MGEKQISFFLHIGQGTGLASASGVRPFLPTLAAGALASAHVGVNFDNSPYSFVAQPGFLACVLALAVFAYAIERRRSGDTDNADGGQRSARHAKARDTLSKALVACALVLGALLFAAAVTTRGELGWPALFAGVLCAGIGFAATTTLFARVRRRLDPSAARLLGLYADLIAVVVAVLAIFAPPLSFLALAGFAFVAVRVRRARAQKYEGLRILR